MSIDEMNWMKRPKHGRSKIENPTQAEVRTLQRKVYELMVENGVLKEKLRNLTPKQKEHICTCGQKVEDCNDAYDHITQGF